MKGSNMVAGFNQDRAIFLPLNDLAAPHYFARTREVLEQSDESGIKTINDAIEVYQCKLIANNYGKYIKDADPNQLNQSAKRLIGTACKVATRILAHQDLSEVFHGVEAQYVYTNAFWDFCDAMNLINGVTDSSFQTLLDTFPRQIRSILRYRKIVQQYDGLIATAMRANTLLSVEIIIGEASCDNGLKHKREFLPRDLSNDDIDQIMLSYLEGPLAEKDLGRCEILAQWPPAANRVYTPSVCVRVLASQASQQLERQLLSDSAHTFRVGVDTAFPPDQKACKKQTMVGDSHPKYSFSSQWLDKYTDSATVLNNLLYVFDFVGPDGIMNGASHQRTMSTLLKILGLHSISEYRTTISATLERMAEIGEVNGYDQLLLRNGTRLEDAISWYFNSYIEEEFGIKGFSISLPTEDTLWLDKCKSIGPEVERVLKAFDVYALKGVVDPAYFRYLSIKDFREIPSLLGNKYLVEGSKFEYPAALLLSDQSLLAYSVSDLQDSSSFYQLILQHRLRAEDFDQIAQLPLKNLVDSGFVAIGADGILSPTARASIVALIWTRGAVDFNWLSVSYGVSDQVKKFIAKEVQGLLSEKIIRSSDRLFSPDEADYLCFLFNDSKFSNAAALRNKYNHGSDSVSDMSEQQLKNDYSWMLSALIGITLKINDDLSQKTHKGGLDADYFVDWPLTD